MTRTGVGSVLDANPVSGPLCVSDVGQMVGRVLSDLVSVA